MASAGDDIIAQSITLNQSSSISPIGAKALETDGTDLYFNGSVVGIQTLFNGITTDEIAGKTDGNVVVTSNLALREYSGTINSLVSATEGLQAKGGYLYYNGDQLATATGSTENIFVDTMQPFTSGRGAVDVGSNLNVLNIAEFRNSNIEFSKSLVFDTTDSNIVYGTELTLRGPSVVVTDDTSIPQITLVSNSSLNNVGTDLSYVKFLSTGDTVDSTRTHELVRVVSGQTSAFDTSGGGADLTIKLRQADVAATTGTDPLVNFMTLRTDPLVGNTIHIGQTSGVDTARVGINAPIYGSNTLQVGTTVGVNSSNLEIGASSHVYFDGSVQLRTITPKVEIGHTTPPLTGTSSISIGQSTQAQAYAVAIGSGASTTNGGASTVSIGNFAGESNQGEYSVAIGASAGRTSQGINSVAIGRAAGNDGKNSSNTISIGYSAGNSLQDSNAVAIGTASGEVAQGSDSVALGKCAGKTSQGLQSIAIGMCAGETTQKSYAIAIGKQAGFVDQGVESISVGIAAGNSLQGSQGVAIGYIAGQTSQGVRSVAIGSGSGRTSQGIYSVSMGYQSGSSTQGDLCVAIGSNAAVHTQGDASTAIGANAASITQGTKATAIGANAAVINQGSQATSIGYEAGRTSQASNSLAIGFRSALLNQNVDSLSIGFEAGYNTQNSQSTAIGFRAGYSMQSSGALSIGKEAGHTSQCQNSIAIGNFSGYTFQGADSISIGVNAGHTSQGSTAIAIGSNAGATSQQVNTTAIGPFAGETSQQQSGLAIGYQAGRTSQGQNSTSIGRNAGTTSQGPNSTAIGPEAAQERQGTSCIAIGASAGKFNQRTQATGIGFQAGENNQGDGALAIGTTAGRTSQGLNATAIGAGAGITSQGVQAVAIGKDAGATSQGSQSVAVGYKSGEQRQGQSALAIGFQSGTTSQGNSATAIGVDAGTTSQGPSATAIGTNAGKTNQGAEGMALGSNAGATSQQTQAIALGSNAGAIGQYTQAVAIGVKAGEFNQNVQSVAIGFEAGNSAQKEASLAIGYKAGHSNQNTSSMAIGYESGFNDQNAYSAAMGYRAGYQNQGESALAIGYTAGHTSQGSSSIALGYAAGYEKQNTQAVAIGFNAGYESQNAFATAIGFDAGRFYQNTASLAIGYNSGYTSQNSFATALGSNAGYEYQETFATAIGYESGKTSQGIRSVAIGAGAGFTGQGDDAIAIGTNAGRTNQGSSSINISTAQNDVIASGSIVLNASSTPLSSTDSNKFYVSPLGSGPVDTASYVVYNNTTKEIYAATDFSFPVGTTVNVGGASGYAAIDPTTSLHIYQASGALASYNTGTIILDHGTADSATSIVFRSNNDFGAATDYGYIQFKNNGGALDDNSVFTIGLGGDSTGTGSVDRIAINTPGALYTDPEIETMTFINGRVGIRTGASISTDPNTVFDVNGFSRLRDGILGGENNGSSNFHIDTTGTGKIYLNWTNSSADVVIAQGGDVGIGTDNIGAKLHVHGPDLSTTDGSRNFVTRSQVNSGNIDKLDTYAYRRGNGSTWESAEWYIQRIVDVTYHNYIGFKVTTTGIGYGGTENITIDHANNRVGINETTPFATLDIVGQAMQMRTTAQDTSLAINTSIGQYAVLESYNFANTVKRPIALNPYGGNVGVGTVSPSRKLHVYSSQAGGDGQGFIVQATNTTNGDYTNAEWTPGYMTNHVRRTMRNKAEYHVFENYNELERMRINWNGNVGIGTNSPVSKLDVNGSMTVRSTGNSGLHIQSTNPNYVDLEYVNSSGVAETGDGNPVMRWGNGYVDLFGGQGHDANLIVSGYIYSSLDRFYLTGSRSITAPSTYGSISVQGNTNSWVGYDIDNSVTFMNNTAKTEWGIYNTIRSHWYIHGYDQGNTEIYFNGGLRFNTDSGGAAVSGRLDVSSYIYTPSYLQVGTIGGVFGPTYVTIGNATTTARWNLSTGSYALNFQKWTGSAWNNEIIMEADSIIRPETDLTGSVGTNAKWFGSGYINQLDTGYGTTGIRIKTGNTGAEPIIYPSTTNFGYVGTNANRFYRGYINRIFVDGEWLGVNSGPSFQSHMFLEGPNYVDWYIGILSSGVEYFDGPTQSQENNGLVFIPSTTYLNGGEYATGAFIDYDSGDNILNNFTGQHRCISDVTLDEVGFIVCTNGKYKNMDNDSGNNIENITINQSLPNIELSTTDNQKNVFGVISDKEDTDTLRVYNGVGMSTFSSKKKGDARIIINSLGEGAIWVSDYSGSLENGDYITTCPIPGLGKKQDSDQLMNYTVAKITMDCDFSCIPEPKKVTKTRSVTTIKWVEKTIEETIYKKNIEFDKESGKYIQKIEEVVKTKIVEEEVDVYDEDGQVIGTQTKPVYERQEVTTEEIELDGNGNVVYVDVPGEMVDPYKMKYIKLDGTILEKDEYESRKLAGEQVYRIAFVGCTYHCG